MASIIIAILAGVAALLWFLGGSVPNQRLRDAAFYLACVALVVVALVVGNVVAGGRP